MLQKMRRLSHSPHASLSAQFFSASINAICLNSYKMFMIVTLPSSMESFQRVIKSKSSFSTRAVPVLRNIDKFWLKTLIFSNNESLPRCFSRALFRFFNISCDFSELYVNNNKYHKYHWWIQGPCRHQRWCSLS